MENNGPQQPLFGKGNISMGAVYFFIYFYYGDNYFSCSFARCFAFIFSRRFIFLFPRPLLKKSANYFGPFLFSIFSFTSRPKINVVILNHYKYSSLINGPNTSLVGNTFIIIRNLGSYQSMIGGLTAASFHFWPLNLILLVFRFVILWSDVTLGI